MAAAGNRGAVTPQGQARTAITNVTQMSNWQSAERTTPNGQARTGAKRMDAPCPSLADTLAD